MIVDPGAATKVTIEASIDRKFRAQHHSFHEDGIIDNDEISDSTDENFMICPPSIQSFELDNNKWFGVDIDRLEEKE